MKKANEVRVRPAREADLEELGEKLATLPLFKAYGVSADALMDRWAQAIKKGEGLLVAVSGGSLAGVCSFRPEGTFGIGAYLRTLAVAPDAQNQGVGAVLLEAFEKACGHPPGGWFLLASDFNEGAHRFYTRHGYTEVGRLRSFAKPGIDERVFWKPLP